MRVLGVFCARTRCGPFRARLHSFIYRSLRLSAPLRPAAARYAPAERSLIHWPEGQCFCLASLARGGRLVRGDLISPRSQKRDRGHPA